MKLDGEILLAPMTELLQRIGAREIRWEPEKVTLPEGEFDITVNAADSPELTNTLFNHPTTRLFHINGKQCLLYIPHGNNFDKLPKFHFMDCSTIKLKYREGRIDRYVITNRTSGLFKMFISEERYSRESVEEEKELKVCKRCLAEWDTYGYKGYRRLTSEASKNQAVDAFNIEEFFATCKSQFKNLPSRSDQSILLSKDNYVENWAAISSFYREKKHWRCEQCGVDLHDHHQYLQVHHRNGVKQDNSPDNLEALCVLCHSLAPAHGHMQNETQVPPEARALILRRRDEMQRKAEAFLRMRV
ncbi:MAG: HNH endonuclease [Fretibacterium sp.]|nr:HNH endonuclease [Fretibacterium sp.]